LIKDEFVIAYDFGTSGVKAVLVNKNAEILAMSIVDYSMITPKVGWAEQDTNEYWDAIIEATRKLLDLNDTNKDSIVALAFSCQAMGIIPIDENDKILYNNISWVDGRAEKQAAHINSLLGDEYFCGKDVVSKLLWLKEERTDIYEKAKYFLDVNGFLKFKATGNKVAELTGASSYCIDLESRQWNKKILEIAGIDSKKLPPIVRATDNAGGLTKRAAEEMNLNAGTPVFGGCDDVHAATIGSATMGELEGHIYLGSSAWLCVSTSEIPEPQNGAVISKSADPEKNLIIGVTQSAGMTIDWGIDNFYRSERADNSVDEYAVIEKEVSSIDPGSDNLIITPWLYGEYCPITSESVRTTIFNLTNLHTRAHVLKAIREGIAYNLRWTKENFYDDYGIDLKTINVVGGGGLSNDWMQILSDVMQVKLQLTVDMRHAGAVGAAVCAMIGMGTYSDFGCLEDIIKIKKEFTPNRNNKQIYDKMFYEYQQLYYSLKDSYERINGIVE